MLTILNNLAPFFEDTSRSLHVRAYSRIMDMSPPTASKVLESLKEEGLLLKRIDKRHHEYRVSGSRLFIGLSRLYWLKKFEELFDFFEGFATAVILFGSHSSGKSHSESDVDIAIVGTKEEPDVQKFEKKYGKEIQIFSFQDLMHINANLLPSILDGYLVRGTWTGLNAGTKASSGKQQRIRH
ncbi:MAG: helix-turn-helix domain-containing protein [Candidatus Woesearchaeota archaeon]